VCVCVCVNTVAVVEAEEVAAAMQTPLFSFISESPPNDVISEPRHLLLETAASGDARLGTEPLSVSDIRTSQSVEQENATSRRSSSARSVEHHTSVVTNSNSLQQSVVTTFRFAGLLSGDNTG